MFTDGYGLSRELAFFPLDDVIKFNKYKYFNFRYNHYDILYLTLNFSFVIFIK